MLTLKLPPLASDAPDSAAGRELIDLLPRLRSLALAVARDPDEAGELVELTLADLGHSPHRSDPRVFRTLVRIWREQVAARPAKVLLADEYDSEVRREVARLPDDQRVALALVLVGGLAYREVAEILEVSVGALTQRLARGRATLLARLETRLTL